MKNFSSSPLHSNNQTPNHIRERNNRKISLLSAIPLRFSLRGYGFCMATLFFFCLGSLFYQLNGGPPKILLDIRQYLGKNLIFLCWLKRVIIKEILWIRKLHCMSRRPALIRRVKDIRSEMRVNRACTSHSPLGKSLFYERDLSTPFTSEVILMPSCSFQRSGCMSSYCRLTRLSESVMMCWTCYEILYPSDLRSHISQTGGGMRSPSHHLNVSSGLSERDWDPL